MKDKIVNLIKDIPLRAKFNGFVKQVKVSDKIYLGLSNVAFSNNFTENKAKIILEPIFLELFGISEYECITLEEIIEVKEDQNTDLTQEIIKMFQGSLIEK